VCPVHRQGGLTQSMSKYTLGVIQDTPSEAS
jgi:hypothetical protein